MRRTREDAAKEIEESAVDTARARAKKKERLTVRAIPTSSWLQLETPSARMWTE